MNRNKKLPRNLTNHTKENKVEIDFKDKNINLNSNTKNEGLNFNIPNDSEIESISMKDVEVDKSDNDIENLETKIVKNEIETNQKMRRFLNSFIKENSKEVISNTNQNSIKEEMKMEINNKVEDLKEVAIISKTMSIKGDLELGSQIIVHGKIFGNLSCKELVEVTSEAIIEGNVNARSLSCVGAEIKGNINVEETFETNNQSKIQGNIDALKVELSGVVNGSINAKESIVLKKTAVVTGDIASPSISIEAGAKLDGRVITKINTDLNEM